MYTLQSCYLKRKVSNYIFINCFRKFFLTHGQLFTYYGTSTDLKNVWITNWVRDENING